MGMNCMVRGLMSRLIDVMHLGNDRVIGAYDVDGVIVDPGPGSTVETLLEHAEPRALLLTHIHLDHAGATGVLVRRNPDLKVYVHERGAPHLIDPSKLLKSASQLYGDDMERLWGEVAPVPEENITVLQGGERIEDDFLVEYAPGHASHHVAYLHEPTGDAYVGDVGGVRVPPSDFGIAPTPPPDIDVEKWHASIDTVAAWRPQRLGLTHFGYVDDVDGQLDRTRAWLDEWGPRARDLSSEEFVAQVEALVRSEIGDEAGDRFVQAAPLDHSYMGLARYWKKRAERDAGS
jgi:glyoxylase-like metal-dependent hydrolase (beta-lactamase superfamily II)